eukprot:4682056-Amphidinium_carterae.1
MGWGCSDLLASYDSCLQDLDIAAISVVETVEKERAFGQSCGKEHPHGGHSGYSFRTLHGLPWLALAIVVTFPIVVHSLND